MKKDKKGGGEAVFFEETWAPPQSLLGAQEGG